MRNPSAKRYDTVSFDTVLADKLSVMDATAIVMCRDNNLPLRIFDLTRENALIQAMAGEEIVQLYVGFKNSAVDRPVKLLRAFDKINLQPGEKKTIPLQVSAQDLAWYNPQTKKWEIEVMDYELYVGGSSATAELLTGSFKLE